MDSLREELENLKEEYLGTVLVGDLNVHSKRWLKFSTGETPEGTALQELCADFGFVEKVKKPTRKENLLDLVLTNLEDAKCTVEPRVADHNLVVASFSLPVPREELVERRVWNFAKADWAK